jgi:L-threonylcarbamoyladenylate synthase
MLVMADEAGIREAARVLAAGGVIAFPTDTVYGLACDLHNAEAVRRVYEIKGRPAAMPLIAMLAEAGQWPEVAREASPAALGFMGRWWPGPLTIILPARADLPAEVLGGGDTVGVRMPDHPVALALLRAVGRALATTSANLSGQAAALTAAEAEASLGAWVDLVLDAGPAPGGLASTVLDCAVDPPAILRAGPVTRVDLGLK